MTAEFIWLSRVCASRTYHFRIAHWQRCWSFLFHCYPIWAAATAADCNIVTQQLTSFLSVGIDYQLEWTFARHWFHAVVVTFLHWATKGHRETLHRCPSLRWRTTLIHWKIKIRSNTLKTHQEKVVDFNIASKIVMKHRMNLWIVISIVWIWGLCCNHHVNLRVQTFRDDNLQLQYRQGMVQICQRLTLCL